MSKIESIAGKTLTTEKYFIPSDRLDSLIPDDGNRIIRDDLATKGKINRIAREFKEKGYNPNRPVIINNNMVIKSGHYRWHAAKISNTGIWVTVDDKATVEEEARLDGFTNKWKNIDFIIKFAKEGIGDYKDILDFVNTYHLPIKIALMLLNDNLKESDPDLTVLLAKGKFKIKNLADAKRKAEQIIDFKDILPGSKDYANIHFASAIIKCLKIKGYRHEEMLRKAKLQGRNFRLQRNRQDTMVMLHKTYNYARAKNSQLVIAKI